MTIVLSAPRETSKKGKTPAQIINKYLDDHYCLELLRFFGTYPLAKFSELAIIHAQNDDSEKSRIRGALGRLVMNRMVGVCIENGNHLYKLTDNDSVHDSIISLAKIEWRQWRKILGEGNGSKPL
ncbi:MAG TPA: hypothetical protein G4O16_07485 [Dehalococcoidia bacterium]|nr:hypothetical protein [Dehalococcoidia bacterium]